MCTPNEKQKQEDLKSLTQIKIEVQNKNKRIILFLALFGFLIAFFAISFILLGNYMITSTRNDLDPLGDASDIISNSEIERLEHSVEKFSLSTLILELKPGQKKEALFAIRNVLEESATFKLQVGEITSESGKYSLAKLSETLGIKYLSEPILLKPNEVLVKPIIFEADEFAQTGNYYIPLELTTADGLQYETTGISLTIQS